MRIITILFIIIDKEEYFRGLNTVHYLTLSGRRAIIK
jgi:hypothetical protein